MARKHGEAPTRALNPHAILERSSRVNKAKKILAIIGADRVKDARRVLEVGCGSGIIASHLGKIGAGRVDVHAVDVLDNRVERSDYRFHLVEGTDLPFNADFFDVVLSNHVIEHVGDEQAQIMHLKEIRRVLRDTGVVYLAVPNRWRLVEPHFQLPLLSWLPRSAADFYVRATGRGNIYDCSPLAHTQALGFFNRAGFSADDQTLEALRATLEIEHQTDTWASLFNRYIPNWLLRLGRGILPTYIFLLRKTPK